MSINLAGTPTATTNAAIISYDTEVKQAYQGASALRGRVKLKTGVVGVTHNFRKMGAGVATQHVSAELITPQDYAHSKIVATLTNWRIGEYTDLFDQAETTVDERAELAKANAMAIGRAEDQLIIDALDAASSLAGTVDEDLGGTNTPINADKLRRAKRLLVAQQAQGGDHTLIINAVGLEGALAETEITSADYQTMRALVDADLNSKKAFGFTFVVLEDRVEGGLPLGSANIRLCFAFDRAAVGLATAIEPTTRVDFIPERAAWLSQGMLKAGAAVIDTKGVVEVQSYEA
jgi:Phage capsid protein